MPYATVVSRRIAYDIDGSVMGYSRSTSYDSGIATWYASAQMGELNDDDLTNVHYHSSDTSQYYTTWLFLIELKEIEKMTMGFYASSSLSFYEIQGSTDTTNGMDGTWETAVLPSGYIINNRKPAWWREDIVPVSFSEPKKVLRWRIRINPYTGTSGIFGYHFYGRKAAGETPDDLLFVDAATGAELTAVTDWGDRPEGTTQFKQVKVKNASSNKTANNVNLQLNHSDFVISWNAGGPWVATLDITSLGVGAESSTIYLKNELGPPNLTLGPKASRIIATVGSWT